MFPVIEIENHNYSMKMNFLTPKLELRLLQKSLYTANKLIIPSNFLQTFMKCR